MFVPSALITKTSGCACAFSATKRRCVLSGDQMGLLVYMPRPSAPVFVTRVRFCPLGVMVKISERPL